MRGSNAPVNSHWSFAWCDGAGQYQQEPLSTLIDLDWDLVSTTGQQSLIADLQNVTMFFGPHCANRG
jgi:hypothetical protein